MLFLSTDRLLFWKRISLMKSDFFLDMANYAIFILVLNLYNPILNIKVSIRQVWKKTLLTKFVWYPCRPHFYCKTYDRFDLNLNKRRSFCVCYVHWIMTNTHTPRMTTKWEAWKSNIHRYNLVKYATIDVLLWIEYTKFISVA
jgi:hypothetical protein